MTGTAAARALADLENAARRARQPEIAAWLDWAARAFAAKPAAFQETVARHGTAFDAPLGHALNVARSVTATPQVTAEDILADLERTLSMQPQHNDAQKIRHAALSNTVQRVRDLIEGCQCRPGLMVPLACDLHPEPDLD